ncbi:MAG: homocysteine S-methyltransferase family protein [Acidobacteria bacterium]|nr:homocysteine S-methyltransferase family protein [Acidobacteriota bacterium]
MASEGLSHLLKRSRPVLIDGAVGTELLRRGIPTTLPLWSAHALTSDAGVEALAGIHSDYARAGADILVTNTFRTTRRVLERAGALDSWRSLNERAVEAARRGAALSQGRPALVAGSIAPLEDCYRPDLVPERAASLAEHRRQIELLAGLGVDLILIETMNRASETVAALEAAADTDLDVILSLCPKTPDRLLSGETLAEVLPEILDVGGKRLRAILLNCAPPETLEEVYPNLAGLVTDRPTGLYAHLGAPDEVNGWTLPEHHEPDRYADWILACLAQGARIVGGCCGTTVEHIAALYRRIES